MKVSHIKTCFEVLLTAELQRIEYKKRQKIKDGMATSPNKPGKKIGTLDKMNNNFKKDILKYLEDKSIKQVDVMKNMIYLEIH